MPLAKNPNTCAAQEPQKCVYTTQGNVMCTPLTTGTPVYHPLKQDAPPVIEAFRKK
jgi:hypothetical protein